MQGFREKLSQIGIDVNISNFYNPDLISIYKVILSYYWELLCNNPDFVSDYNCLRTEVDKVSKFVQKWKLPKPYERALIVECIKGLPNKPNDIKPHFITVSINLKIEPPKLPEWYPYLESAESYTKRVMQLVQEYKSKVEVEYKREGLYVKPNRYAKWRDADYQKDIAKMLYARVVENKRDTEYVLQKVPSTVLKECRQWLIRLGFPPDTLKRKRGRPPKKRNCENQR